MRRWPRSDSISRLSSPLFFDVIETVLEGPLGFGEVTEARSQLRRAAVGSDELVLERLVVSVVLEELEIELERVLEELAAHVLRQWDVGEGPFPRNHS